MAAWLTGEVRQSFGSPWYAATERAVFGDLTPEEIVDAVAVECERAFGSRLDDGFLYHVSAGVVFGCRLRSGRRLILKAYQPRWGQSFLGAVKRVQSNLYAAGFPCPQPIEVGLTIGSAAVLAEEVLPDPGIGRATTDVMRASAAGLARLIGLCRTIDEPSLSLHPLRAPHVGLFPEPHSPIFDFEATKHGAEWIDAVARKAKLIRDEDESEPVIAHTDWSLRNRRVDTSGLVAVYDWDSLALVPEPEAVALAAVSWCKTGEGNDPTPSIEDVEGYVEVYEAAAGKHFSGRERRSLRGAAILSMAYTARCEHAVDPEETIWTSTRPRLREAAALLA